MSEKLLILIKIYYVIHYTFGNNINYLTLIDKSEKDRLDARNFLHPDTKYYVTYSNIVFRKKIKDLVPKYYDRIKFIHFETNINKIDNNNKFLNSIEYEYIYNSRREIVPECEWKSLYISIEQTIKQNNEISEFILTDTINPNYIYKGSHVNLLTFGYTYIIISLFLHENLKLENQLTDQLYDLLNNTFLYKPEIFRKLLKKLTRIDIENVLEYKPLDKDLLDILNF